MRLCKRVNQQREYTPGKQPRVVSVQSLSRVQLFATPRTAADQASLSIIKPGMLQSMGSQRVGQSSLGGTKRARSWQLCELGIDLWPLGSGRESSQVCTTLYNSIVDYNKSYCSLGIRGFSEVQQVSGI